GREADHAARAARGVGPVPGVRRVRRDRHRQPLLDRRCRRSGGRGRGGVWRPPDPGPRQTRGLGLADRPRTGAGGCRPRRRGARLSSSPPGPAASTTEPPPRPGPRRASQVRTAADVRSLARNRLIESRLTPNAISMTGFGLNVAAAVLVTQRLFFLAGIAFVVGSVMDTLDGRYSRMSGKGTAFGAFLDSTLDRVEEGIVLAAVAAYFSTRGDDLAVAAVVVTVLGSLMVSYTRARA